MKQRAGLFQITGLKSLGEPVIGSRQHAPGLGLPALRRTESAQAHHGSKLEGLRFLAPGNLDGDFKGGLSLNGIGQQFALEPMEFLRRLAEHEMLYFRREEPHERVSEDLVVLLDQGVRTWGPVTVDGPAGPAAGFVVLLSVPADATSLTIERQFVPGVGMVRETIVRTVGGKLVTRQESVLTSTK